MSSMIVEQFEDFARLRPAESPDGLGGMTDRRQADCLFGALLIHEGDHPGRDRGRAVTGAVYTLFHSPDVTLVPGDRVRRLADGGEYVITGEDEGTPAFAPLQLKCARAERRRS